jgi:hypothetical protein
VDKQKSATNTIVQRGSIRPTLKVGQTDFNVGEQKKSARPISQIGQASCEQKLQHTYKDGVLIPYPLIHQNLHRWRMCAGLAHNERRCVPQSQLCYDQSSSSKAGTIKPVLVKLTNQVQQKDAPIKESEGPIVIDNLDPSDVEKISRGTIAHDHDAQSSISAPKNF